MQGHVVVVGNEKGGSGKSTTAMHLAVGLMRAGHSVAVIDTDIRQGSLRRFLENRRDYARSITGHVPMPDYFEVAAMDAVGDGADALSGVLAAARAAAGVVIIDTPGSATALSEAAHSFADTLVTPLNDSFVDLDVLARVEVGDAMTVKGPSQYAEMVWKQKIVRARRDGGNMDWVVIRNRLSPLDSRNHQEMEKALSQLAQRIGFRFLPGFGERVIYRELFLAGLTIMDIRETADAGGLSMSHLAARQEVRALISDLRLPFLAA
ncbi:MAG: ATPase [Rhodospirillales bacterium CG15_BIG_FIL_POST_REV_8_21_14_020_66_15]|nr:MAG: ATPase [Rhodospirillales bacterium CG15_BIG_FIL_POST_REV_8_21_14_020_66_15]